MLILLSLLLSLGFTQASVIGIDYGTDWFKVSIVKPGVPLEVVLNQESKRKTSSIVTIRNGIRYFGSDSVALVSLIHRFDSKGDKGTERHLSSVKEPVGQALCRSYCQTVPESLF
jgi:molecular chaperone DnaK (HSP70)